MVKSKKRPGRFTAWLNSFSRRELSEKLGVHFTLINRWAQHRNLPGAETMRRIQVMSGGKITYAVMINEFLSYREL